MWGSQSLIAALLSSLFCWAWKHANRNHGYVLCPGIDAWLCRGSFVVGMIRAHLLLLIQDWCGYFWCSGSWGPWSLSGELFNIINTASLLSGSRVQCHPGVRGHSFGERWKQNMSLGSWSLCGRVCGSIWVGVSGSYHLAKTGMWCLNKQVTSANLCTAW